MLQYTTRPLSDRSWLRPVGRVDRSRFTAKWSNTLNILERELHALRARTVVMGIDITESEIRNDGGVRANARPASPGVELAFDSQHGPLIYRCDLFTRTAYGSATQPWQDNVRCIALTLESLRAVDRYGATASGEQYRGFKALGAGTGSGHSHMTREDGEALVRKLAHVDDQYPLDDAAIRRAKARAHPDSNDGDRRDWDLLMKALEVLGES